MTGAWQWVEIAGHPCDVFAPEDPCSPPAAVIYLHGVHLGRLRDHEAFTGQFARHGLSVIAPMTGRSWWTDRICAEFDAQLSAQQHVLENVLPYVTQRFGVRPPRVGLLGTSMGGQGALRFAFKFPDLFPVVAAISPAIDYQWRMEGGDETLDQMYADEEAARQDTATLHVHPLNWPRNIWFASDPTDWPWHDSAEKLSMKLSSLGIPFECDLETSRGGHGFEYYDHMALRAVQFLVDRLEMERVRLDEGAPR